MKIKNIETSFDLLVLEDVYDDNQTSEIWKELEMLIKSNALLPPELSGSAEYDDGSYKKKNKSLFLDFVYQENYRFLSPILKYTEEILLSPEIKDMMEKINPAHGILKVANQHGTLVSYYEKEDAYDFHTDNSAYSTLSYFYKEPKSFLGGEIVFDVNGEVVEIPIQNNMSIIFPSCYRHMVKPIKMKEEDLNKGLGRFCISQFIGINLF